MTAERFYAALLTLYPRAFRDAYGEDVLGAFRELYRASRRHGFAFWQFALADLLRSATREQMDACRHGTRRFVLGWLATCALGIVATGLLAVSIAGLFAYLYHPYLEGFALVPWTYGALLGAGLGIAQSLALRHRPGAAFSWVVATSASASLGLHLAALVAGPAGAVAGGIAVGAVVGGCQWTLVRIRLRRPAWSVLASAISLSVAVFLFDSLIQRALTGVDPLAADFRARAMASSQYAVAIGAVTRGLQPHDWAEAALSLFAMAVSGLTVGAITARPLSGGRHAHQASR